MTEPSSNVVRVFIPEPTEDEDEFENTKVDPDVTIVEALNLGIFAINTFHHPDASSDEDLATLDTRGGRAIEVLAAVRERVDLLVAESITTGPELPDGLYAVPHDPSWWPGKPDPIAEQAEPYASEDREGGQ